MVFICGSLGAKMFQTQFSCQLVSCLWILCAATYFFVEKVVLNSFCSEVFFSVNCFAEDCSERDFLASLLLVEMKLLLFFFVLGKKRLNPLMI